MKTYSYVKCIIALSILSLYIWLFGISGVIGVENGAVFADESVEFNPSLSDMRQPDTTNPPTLTDAPITSYATSIDVINDPKPGFGDYPSQTTAPYYYGNAEESTSSEEETTAEESSEITTTTTTAGSSAETTTTSATVPEATTTTTTSSAGDGDIDDLEVAEETTTTAGTTTTAPPASSSSEQLTVYTVSGETVTDSALNIISRIVQNEIGSAFEIEAIKAQAVASYTYVRLYNDNGEAARGIRLASVASDRVKTAVAEVLGETITYGGQIIQAVYSASSAGYTASSVNVWGTDYPYLRSVPCELDVNFDVNYGVKTTLSSTDLMAVVLAKTGIQLSGDPAGWLNIVTYVDTVYVGQLSIGGRTSYTNSGGNEVSITGRVFREQIMSAYNFRSAAFDILYDAGADQFIFTTYGYGHGVGLSQNGANNLAKHYGYTYRDILGFYYPGTNVA